MPATMPAAWQILETDQVCTIVVACVPSVPASPEIHPGRDPGRDPGRGACNRCCVRGQCPDLLQAMVQLADDLANVQSIRGTLIPQHLACWTN
jgi:hypothetical protein